MTFQNVQDRVMARGNRSSTEARARIKDFINERLRAVQTSVGLGRTRQGIVSVNTTSGTATVTTTGLVKVQSVTLPALNRVLEQVETLDIRRFDSDASTSAAPAYFAVNKFNATTVSLTLWPKPDATYALSIEGVLVGTDLSANSDVPGLPEDFHDILVFGALADEHYHDGDTKTGDRMESKFEARKRELRYFVNKTAAMCSRGSSPWPWWWTRVV